MVMKSVIRRRSPTSARCRRTSASEAALELSEGTTRNASFEAHAMVDGVWSWGWHDDDGQEAHPDTDANACIRLGTPDVSLGRD